MKKLLFFHAKWCPPCRNALNNVVMPLKEKYKNKVEVIDVQLEVDRATKEKVRRLPCFILKEDGIEVWRGEGTAYAENLESHLKDKRKNRK